MQDESIPTPIEDADRVQQTILLLLLGDGEQRHWSESEIELEIGRHLPTVDALARLQAVGLIHRCGEFVFATRAAVRADALRL
jgi:hypothetical protein